MPFTRCCAESVTLSLDELSLLSPAAANGWLVSLQSVTLVASNSSQLSLQLCEHTDRSATDPMPTAAELLTQLAEGPECSAMEEGPTVTAAAATAATHNTRPAAPSAAAPAGNATAAPAGNASSEPATRRAARRVCSVCSAAAIRANNTYCKRCLSLSQVVRQSHGLRMTDMRNTFARFGADAGRSTQEFTALALSLRPDVAQRCEQADGETLCRPLQRKDTVTERADGETGATSDRLDDGELGATSDRLDDGEMGANLKGDRHAALPRAQPQVAAAEAIPQVAAAAANIPHVAAAEDIPCGLCNVTVTTRAGRGQRMCGPCGRIHARLEPQGMSLQVRLPSRAPVQSGEW